MKVISCVPGQNILDTSPITFSENYIKLYLILVVGAGLGMIRAPPAEYIDMIREGQKYFTLILI